MIYCFYNLVFKKKHETYNKIKIYYFLQVFPMRLNGLADS